MITTTFEECYETVMKHNAILKRTAPSAAQIPYKGFYEYTPNRQSIAAEARIDEKLMEILQSDQIAELKKLRKFCFVHDNGDDVETLNLRSEDTLSNIEDFSSFHAYHGLIGLPEEVKELHDAVMNNDPINILEESGDILWFLGQVLRSKGYTILDAMAANTAKLTKRYLEKAEGFTEKAFDNRNVAQEMQAVESAVKPS